MTLYKPFAAAVLLTSVAAHAQQPLPPPQATPLLTQMLADQPGKEAVLMTVEYPPGGGDPVHRHDAHGFIYVLEGSIVMGVRGGESVTLKPGQTFYEGPNDIHTVGRNASLTEPARFLVVLLKNKDKPVFIPEQ